MNLAQAFAKSHQLGYDWSRAKEKIIFSITNRSNRRCRSPLRYFWFETGVPLAQVSRKGRLTPYRPFHLSGPPIYSFSNAWDRFVFRGSWETFSMYAIVSMLAISSLVGQARFFAHRLHRLHRLFLDNFCCRFSDRLFGAPNFLSLIRSFYDKGLGSWRNSKTKGQAN